MSYKGEVGSLTQVKLQTIDDLEDKLANMNKLAYKLVDVLIDEG